MTGFMGIKSASEYIDFFANLNMGENASLLGFLNNEMITLKRNLKLKNLDKEPIKRGIAILEQLAKEINDIGDKAVLEIYRK